METKEVKSTEERKYSVEKTEERAVVYEPNPAVSYDPNRDPAAQQLFRYMKSNENQKV